MIRQHGPVRLAAWALFLAACLLPSAGCIGFLSNMVYWAKGGHKVPAAYDGLAGKKVAVVCVSSSNAFGPTALSDMVEQAVTTILQERCAEIDLIHHDEVADWVDNNDWDQVDYRDIGRGVNADVVLAIDLDNVSLHEGRTLYKGRADVTVKVYDMADDGKIVFRREIPEFSFPTNGARHSTELSEAQFRRLFVLVLAQQVTKYFYDYQFDEDFARDTAVLAG